MAEFIPGMGSNQQAWSKQEEERLTMLWKNGAKISEICEALPKRSKHGIQKKRRDMGLAPRKNPTKE